MKRVLILGCGGAGKSTLARTLGERTGLPVVHLDQGWWLPGWHNPPEEVFDRWLQEQLEKETWIIDGNYLRTLELRLARADTVLFLDYPVRTCLWGVLRRVVRYWGRTRPDMGEECPERLDSEFFRWILDFRRETRPEVLERLSRWAGTVRVFRSRSACRHFLKELRQPSRGGPASN